MVAFSGFFESHKPPPSGNACSILPRHHMAIETASIVGVLCIIVLLIVALAAAGPIRSELLPDGGVQWLPE